MERFAIVSLLAATSACGFTGKVAAGGDAPLLESGAADMATSTSLDIAHVNPADLTMLTSTADWNAAAATTLDTGTGAIDPPLPAGVVAGVLTQAGQTSEIYVIQAQTIEIGATLRVTGSRPLVLVGTTSIAVAGEIDGSAIGKAAGPGGADPGAGPGAGPAGSSDDNSHDAGGAGASFGTLGKAGGIGGPGSGTVTTQPKPPLPTYGDATLAVLQGGSGGGDPSPMCGTDQRFGGAGGGAVQLTAPAITLDGAIHVGGGGADAVGACAGNGLGGGGGGSGGAIYLQATTLGGMGMLAANGGGGSGSGKGDGTAGPAGADGRPDTTAASGGIGQYGNGGDGAALVDATAGTQGDNAGGGGGGAGRIFFNIPTAAVVTITTSPPAARR